MNVQVEGAPPGRPLPDGQCVSTTLRVVDANQLPDENGRIPNVATQFRLGPDGQAIEVGSRIVPPPPHDASRDEGVGAVFWRGFKAGFSQPGAFFSATLAMRRAALRDQPFTPAQFHEATLHGGDYDAAMQGSPIVGAALQIAEALAGLVDWAIGNGGDGAQSPPVPAPVEPMGTSGLGDAAGGQTGSSARAGRRA